MRKPEFLILRVTGTRQFEPDGHDPEGAELDIFAGAVWLEGERLRVRIDGESFFVKGRPAEGLLTLHPPVGGLDGRVGLIRGYLPCANADDGFIEVYVGCNGIGFEYPETGYPARFHSGNITVVSLPGGRAMYAVSSKPQNVAVPRCRDTRDSATGEPVNLCSSILEAIAAALAPLTAKQITAAVEEAGIEVSEKTVYGGVHRLFVSGRIIDCAGGANGSRGRLYGLPDWPILHTEKQRRGNRRRGGGRCGYE